jgi:radical SAM protein with 4Fe4S-binding SPASM domain
MCGFAVEEMVVAPSGRIYPCERMVGEDAGRFAIGSAADGIDDARRAALVARDSCGCPSCASCAIATRCASHCRATNHAATGKFDEPGDAFCEHERAVARIADRIGDELISEGTPAFVAEFGRFVPDRCR